MTISVKNVRKLIVIFMMFSGSEQYFVYSTPKSRNGYQVINVKWWWRRLQTLAVALPKQNSLLCYFLTLFISSGYQSEAYSILCPYYVTIMKLYKHIRTDVKIRVFTIRITCWSGFVIFEQNRGSPDEIRMVGQSDIVSLSNLANCFLGEGDVWSILVDEWAQLCWITVC